MASDWLDRGPLRAGQPLTRGDQILHFVVRPTAFEHDPFVSDYRAHVVDELDLLSSDPEDAAPEQEAASGAVATSQMLICCSLVGRRGSNASTDVHS